jgi:glutathione S-transferase
MTCSPDTTLSGFVKMTNGGLTRFVSEVNLYRGENAYIRAVVNKPKSTVKISFYRHPGSAEPIYSKLLHITVIAIMAPINMGVQHDQVRVSSAARFGGQKIPARTGQSRVSPIKSKPTIGELDMDLTLVVGSKTFSSWSLRPWLLMKQARIPFKEVVIALNQVSTREQIKQYSPSGRIPVLLHGDVRIWDSLAISEYLHEQFPEKALWPRKSEDRALARSVSAEMHSGFAAMRQQLSMNVTKRFPTPALNDDAQSDLKRVFDIWNDCFNRFGGPFLFGDFTIADAMYAPVTTRMTTYSIPLTGAIEKYVQTMTTLPAMLEWVQAAQGEAEG